jgi:predicted nucleic acid-binding protein
MYFLFPVTTVPTLIFKQELSCCKEWINSTVDSWLAAGELRYALRRKGITLPATDLLIAAAEKVNNCSIFTIGFHFKGIPGIDLHSLP